MSKLYFNCLVLGFFFITIGASQPNSINSGYINVKDGELYYEMYGHGDETIVFIHDGLVHGEVWDNQFSTFSDKFRVVRYDRRGYGRSPKPEKTSISITCCPYAIDCPIGDADCKENEPELAEIAAGHRVACFKV